MKNFWIFSLVIFSFFAASAQPVSLQFEIKDYPDSIAYIGYFLGSQKYVMDTVEVDGSQFNVQVQDPKEGMYFVYSPKYYLEFIMDGHSFSIRTTREGAYKDMRVTGSAENVLFKDFQVTMGELQAQQRAVLEQLKSGVKKDSLNARKRLIELEDQMGTVRENLIVNNAGTFVASFLALMEHGEVPEMLEIEEESERRMKRYHYYKKHYFDLINLADPRLLRTPLLHSKVMEYFDKVVPQHPDSLNHEIDWFFGQLGTDEELFRYWLVTLFKKYAESTVMGMDAVMVHLIEAYYLTDRADWITEEYEKQLREEVAYLKYSLIGEKAPPLNVVDTLMQSFTLAQVDAPYTLLFIYDPDCGHCKKTVKKLEEYDAKMADLGIQVVAVCTTTDVDRWKKFVNSHNPMWQHAIDPTGKSYFRVYYNVRSTPQIYLLDESKTIVAKRLDIEQFVDYADKHSAQVRDRK